MDHGGQISPLGVSQLDRKAPRYRADELEAVHRRTVNIQYRLVCLGIRGVIASAGDAFKRLKPGVLFPTTIFNSVASFMTNTNLQHYSGDQHFSNFSQVFFCVANYFLSASVGFCALSAIIRLFRRDSSAGNYFVDMWRLAIYIFLPVAFLLSIIFLQQGTPMTFKAAYQVSTLEPGAMGTADDGQPKQQIIVTGPVAATVPMEQLGTNGGGFFGMNFAHPYQSPTTLTNFVACFAMMVFPFSLVLMYGRMLNRI
jgi:potassium-transporting ATPase potassium-binding subunit